MKRTSLLLLVVVALAGACKQQETQVTESAATSAPAATAAEAPQVAGTAPAVPGTDPGAVMPAYASKYLDGRTFDVAERRGTVMLLNVWATWCGPCRYEIPELQAIHDRYAAKGFEVVGVSVDEGGADGVKQFVAEQKMTYPVVLDAEGTLANILQTSVLPTSIIVGRDGKIVWKKYGAIMPDDQELKSAIEGALAGQS
jgi:thiol-disulfide isomerase/thioredoxin